MRKSAQSSAATVTVGAAEPYRPAGDKAADARRQALLALPTPAVVVERSRLLHNIDAVQRIADDAGVALRPHIKTHKCLEIGALQLQAGAVGVTASKVDEALVFIAAGVPSMTIAYPIVDAEKARRAMVAAKEKGCELRFIADSEVGLDAVESAAATVGLRPGLFLKIDVGLRRVGLPPDSPLIAALARRVADSPQLSFRGLLSHAGHAYGANSPAEVTAVAESERRRLLEIKARLQDEGLEVKELSVGSTPSVLLAASFDGLSELRPGNYVFYDLTALRLGVVGLADIALGVLSTVVSVNDDYAIVDAGSKVLSSDLGPHGTSGIRDNGMALPFDAEIGETTLAERLSVEKLSEEHGFVRLEGRRAKVGERLMILPNHSCPVANLAEKFYVLDDDGSVAEWPVAAGRKVQ